MRETTVFFILLQYKLEFLNAIRDVLQTRKCDQDYGAPPTPFGGLVVETDGGSNPQCRGPIFYADLSVVGVLRVYVNEQTTIVASVHGLAVRSVVWAWPYRRAIDHWRINCMYVFIVRSIL